MVGPRPPALNSSTIRRRDDGSQCTIREPLLTSPVEATFRAMAPPPAADDIPDLVPSAPSGPSDPSPAPTTFQAAATFPRRGGHRSRLSHDTFTLTHPRTYGYQSTPTTPLHMTYGGMGVGGVSMVRSVSQPVLTSAEHAAYTATRSLGRAAGARLLNGGVGEGMSGRMGERRRPSLFGALAMEDAVEERGEVATGGRRGADGGQDGPTGGDEDGDREDEEDVRTDADGDVEMASDDRAIHARAHSQSHLPSPTSPRAFCYDEYPPYSAPLDAPLASSFAPRRTLSPCPTRMAASFDLRSAYPRTPSPGPAPHRQTSRLMPTSGPRVRPAHHAGVGGRASPTPSTSTRAAAWRKGVRCVPRFPVEETV